MKPPVFALGCARSGTTLLYSLLLAGGGFTVYRKETHFYDLLPRFPDLTTPDAQSRFLQQFLDGYLGKVAGLDVERFARGALAGCRAPADFLPRLMDAITEAQGMDRWLEATPAHLLYMDQIAETVPDALFIHVIRDGRDCALSNARQNWLSTFPWDKERALGVAALYWEWMVRRGRAFGRAHPDRYLEVRFEELVGDQRATIERVGRFIDHDLDYDVIQQHPVHSLKNPNTSFRSDRKAGDFQPVGRWKTKLSPDDLRLCESLIGPYLEELGYELAGRGAARTLDARARVMRASYLADFTTKHWLKTRTPLGRLMTKTTAWAQQPNPGEHLPQPFTRRRAVTS
jgi:hypothetical protein